MFTSMCLVSVSAFNGTADKNGKNPVILNILAGKSPNRTVLSGTIAERLQLRIGESYLMQCRETEANEYGRQFVWTVVGKASVMDVLSGSTTLGQPEIFPVGTKVDPKSTPELTPEEIEAKKLLTA